MLALSMVALYMLTLAVLTEAVRAFREALEAESVIVISRNTVDVNPRRNQGEGEDCTPGDPECVRIVEEVVSPVNLSRCHWRHLRNSLLYGIQCGIQLQLLVGVLSLNVWLIGAILVGYFLGSLMFNWRPRFDESEKV